LKFNSGTFFILNFIMFILFLFNVTFRCWNRVIE
jgi:hypothetical protein